MVTDTQGRKADFRNTVIVMTSNVGAARITAKGGKLGFQSALSSGETRPLTELKEAVMGDLKRVFRPEFLNRLDDTIVFRQLEREQIRTIARRMLDGVGERLVRLGVSLHVEEDALEQLAREGFAPDYGARPLRRAIRARVEDPAAEALLSGALQAGGAVRLVLREGALALEPQSPATNERSLEP